MARSLEQQLKILSYARESFDASDPSFSAGPFFEWLALGPLRDQKVRHIGASPFFNSFLRGYSRILESEIAEVQAKIDKKAQAKARKDLEKQELSTDPVGSVVRAMQRAKIPEALIDAFKAKFSHELTSRSAEGLVSSFREKRLIALRFADAKAFLKRMNEREVTDTEVEKWMKSQVYAIDKKGIVSFGPA